MLGGGSGLKVQRLISESDLIAIDISENRIKKLEEKKLHDRVASQTFCGSFLDRDLENNHYDSVVSSYTVHHFNETQRKLTIKNT